MRIAIPVAEKNIESSVCVSFGRTPCFLIYDTETKEITSLDNGAAASTGGAGIKTAQIIIDNSINVLLAARLGTNAAEVLKSAKITVYKTIPGSAKDNINAFLAGKLALLNEIPDGFHGNKER